MTPTHTFDGGDVRLYLADSIDIIPHLPESAHVITDPPYGMALTVAGCRADRGERPAFRSRHAIRGDSGQEVGEQAIAACRARGWPLLAFAKPELPWPGPWRQYLVWDKGEAVGIGGDRETTWKRTWELIQVGRFPKVFGERDGSILRYPVTVGACADGRTVPYAKPVRLLKYLLTKLVPRGGLVVDPFMGSGSLAVACLQLGYPFIGIEIDPEMYRTAVAKVATAVGKGTLFEEVAS